MKVLLLFFVVCLLAVSAQRRPSKHDTDFEATSHKPVSRSRGKARFSLTPEFQQANEEFKSVQKTELLPRRRTENVHSIDRKPSRPPQDLGSNRRSYEVREVIDDVPRETVPKLKKKPHVITETKFEATNAPKKDEVVPSPAPVEDLMTPSSAPEQIPQVESSEKPTEETVMQSSEPTKPLKVEPEPKRKIPERHNLRTKTNVPQKVEETSRTRSRGKLTHREEQRSSTVPTNTPRVQVKVNRRRPEPTPEVRHNPLRTKGPSVFSAENSADLPSRSRPGRRVPINTNRASEQITEDPNPSNVILPRRRLVERRKSPTIVQEVSESSRKIQDAPKEQMPVLVDDVPKVKVDAEESITATSQRRDISRLRQNVRATVEPAKNVPSVPRRADVRRGRTTDAPVTTSATKRSGVLRESPESTSQYFRTRSRVKPAGDNVDAVVTNPTRGVWSRRRLPSGSIDDIDAASTRQTEVRVKADNLSTQNVKVSLEKSFSEETKSGRIRKRPSSTTRRSTQIRESNSDVSDQPSKIPLLNLKNPGDGERRGPQIGRPRGRTPGKKVNGDGLSNSQENIDESDNYPAAFKAAIKAKKTEGNLGSRTTNVNEASITKTTEATVTSSIASTSLKTFPYAAAVAPSVVNKNEETSTSRSSKYPRPRFSLATKQSKSEDVPEIRKYKPDRTKNLQSTTPHNENSNKFHARYKSPVTENAAASEKLSIKPRTYVPKPPKGIYSSRKSTRSSTSKPDNIDEFSSKFNLEKSSLSTKIPSIGLSAKNRFSARYRNEILPKSAVHRVTTIGPSYIPTVPTVTPSSSTVKVEDRIQGLEVISIFDQVSNTLPSDNLVSDASLSPEVLINSVTAQTEKTMSFIERIINSITAISTTTSPDSSTTSTTTNGQTTKSSAILNLVSKRQNLDPAVLRQTFTNSDFKTTEKPTTIIEQILSSLTAIRADTATESTASNTMQVGNSAVTTTTTAPFTDISVTTPMFNSESTSSVSDSIISSTASVSSTALFTDTTSTLASIEEENTIPPRTQSVQPRFFTEPISTLYNTTPDTITIEKLLALLDTTIPKPTENTVLVTPRSSTFLRSNTDSSTADKTTPMLFTSEIDEEIITKTIEPSTPETTLSSSTTETTSSTESIFNTPTTQSEAQSSTLFQSTSVDVVTPSVPTSAETGPYPASLSITNQTVNLSTVTNSVTASTVGESLTTVTPLTMTAQSSASAVQTASGPYPPSTNTTTSPDELITTSDITLSSEVGVSTLTTSLKASQTVTGPYPGSVTSFATTEATSDSKLTQTHTTSTTSLLTTANIISETTPTSSVGTTAVDLFPYPSSTTENDIIAQSSTISEVTFRFTTTPTTTPQTTTDSDTSSSINLESASTVPTLSRFEVSPDRVTIYSPNDISSTLIPDETAGTTVSITGRALTTDPTVTTTTTTKPYPDSQPTTTTVKTTTNTIDKTTKDVSSNTINTNSVTDKPNLSNMINPLSANTNVTTELPPSTGTSTNKSIMMEVTNREGKRLTFQLMNPPNDISNSDESQRDYYIFAVLQNNTILRKRPSRFPNKKIPFLIYGLLPNNTLVQKFPNGTIVPMEPVIQVNGFDTRENPPLPPELISNQVTGNEDSQRNNKQLTVDVEDKSEANQLSVDSQVLTKSNLPPVVELLGGKTIDAFNDIVNQTKKEESNKVQTLDVDRLTNRVRLDNIDYRENIIYRWKPIVRTNSITNFDQVQTRFGNGIDPTTQSPSPTTTSTEPSTTEAQLTSPTTTRTTTTTDASTTTTTVAPTSITKNPTTTSSSTTDVPTTSTTNTGAPITTSAQEISTTTSFISTTSTDVLTSSKEPTLFTSPLSATSIDVDANALAIGVNPSTVPTPTPVTLIELLTKGASIPSATTLKVPSLKNLELNEDRLTEQQKQDLAILRALEKEQEAILKQLAFLTGLNLRGTASPGEGSLADRVIAQAVEKTKIGATNVPTNAPFPAVNDLIKQFNTVTPTSPVVSSTYGKTSDALLASLLKEYGVGPTTPKGFSDAFTKELLTTTKPPTRKTTTQAPGPLMQGLNWLLNTLSPQPSPKPKPKPKPVTTTTSTTTTTTTTPKEELINQATTLVPVIARFDQSQFKNAVITDKQLEALILQLEAIQKDPKKAKSLDIQSFKNLQNPERSKFLTDLPKISSSSAPVILNELKPLVISRGGTGQASTPLPLSITNSIEDADTKTKVTQAPIVKESTTSRIPPVKLNPVPGVPDEGPKIRGQLVNYAINITKAISSFLGTALQGAASTFQSLIGSVSRPDRNYYNSNSSNRPG